MKNLTVSVCLIMLFATPAIAQNYIVNVHGMVCELCSLGVAKNIRKLSFVDAANMMRACEWTFKTRRSSLQFAMMRRLISKRCLPLLKRVAIALWIFGG